MKNAEPIPFPVAPEVVTRLSESIAENDSISEFDLETPGVVPVSQSVPGARSFGHIIHRPNWLVAVLALLAIAQAPIVVLWALQSRAELRASAGIVAIDTVPAGIQVTVDGKALGPTPLEISLAAGQRHIELRHGDVVRSIPMTVTPGQTVRHRVEFISTAQAVVGDSKPGTLHVTTDPSRVTVVVDGIVRGISPLSVADLAAGKHRLAVRFPAGAVEREVEVHAGATASVQIAMPSIPGLASGWVAIRVASPLRISESGRFLGTTDIDRLMLPVGDHVLDIHSDELGFRVQRTVHVAAGATTTIQLELPAAALSINARPWAEAWVDGESVGETPIGNLSRTIGRHEVVLRHPALGERRESVVVTLNQPARVSVDLRQR